jgi:hypothetical protein
MTSAIERIKEHEPQMYACEGPITSDSRGNFTFAFLGCSCGWNRGGKAKDKFSDHLAALLTDIRLEEAKEFNCECNDGEERLEWKCYRCRRITALEAERRKEGGTQ